MKRREKVSKLLCCYYKIYHFEILTFRLVLLFKKNDVETEICDVCNKEISPKKKYKSVGDQDFHDPTCFAKALSGSSLTLLFFFENGYLKSQVR